MNKHGLLHDAFQKAAGTESRFEGRGGAVGGNDGFCVLKPAHDTGMARSVRHRYGRRNFFPGKDVSTTSAAFPHRFGDDHRWGHGVLTADGRPPALRSSGVASKINADEYREEDHKEELLNGKPE